MGFDNSVLSDRKKLILRAIVEAHIKLGEPVGSKYLMQEAKIPLKVYNFSWENTT